MLAISGYEQSTVLKRTSQWLRGKEFACSAEDVGLIPRLGRSPGERKWRKKRTPVFFPRKSHGQSEYLAGYSP